MTSGRQRVADGESTVTRTVLPGGLRVITESLPAVRSAAFGIWAVLTFLVFAVSLVWSGMSGGISRWVLAAAALAPWGGAHAISLGQVVPLVAAGVVVSWRLLREEKQIAAGLALAVIFLKPNTAILVPVALLAAGRYRAFVAWLGAGGVVAVVALLAHRLARAARARRSPRPTRVTRPAPLARASWAAHSPIAPGPMTTTDSPARRRARSSAQRATPRLSVQAPSAVLTASGNGWSAATGRLA